MAHFNDAALAALDDALADFDLEGVSADAPVTALVPVTTLEPIAIEASAPMSECEQFYCTMSRAEAEELRNTANDIRTRHRSTILETGNDLLRIKDRLPGKFDLWLKLEFSWSKSTAWNYINAVQQFGATPKVIEHLPQGTVYKLAAKATPEEVRRAVVEEINSGLDVPAREVERRIDEAKAVERARLKAEQEKAEEERAERDSEERWLEREKQLKEAGQTDPEIATARKKWLTPKERKARARLEQERYVLRREAKIKKDREEMDAKYIRRKQAEAQAVDFLRDKLGADFEIFQSMLREAGHSFQYAMKRAA